LDAIVAPQLQDQRLAAHLAQHDGGSRADGGSRVLPQESARGRSQNTVYIVYVVGVRMPLQLSR